MSVNPNLRISTITLISGLNTNVSLNDFYENLEINDKFKYIEFGSNPVKGEKVNKIKNPRKKKEKKFFYNQLTLHVFKDKIVNVKIFNNGRFQMTGLKSKEQGIEIVKIILDYIVNLPDDNKEKVIDNLEPELIDSKIVLINSDFDIHFKINREALHRIIISRGYYSSYEPTIYPGVNIKYYYNEKNDNGICNCSKTCNGKGKDGCCKKVTIAVFNSGKTIITGGQSLDHLNIAYDFITKLVKENQTEIKH